MARTPADAWSGWTAKQVKRLKVAVYKLPNGTFEAFAGLAKIPEGAELLNPQPAFPTSGDPHEGTRVAMKALEGEYPVHIAWACHIAVQLAKRRLTVHSREVRDEMERQGLVGPDTGREFWLGAAFNRLAKAKPPILEKKGTHKYSDASRGIHERTVSVWALIEGADTAQYDVPPKARP